jgi:hypothetical protein
MALRIAHGFFRLWLLVSVIWILIAGPFMWWALVSPVINHEKWYGPGGAGGPVPGPTLIESITWVVLVAFGPPALMLVIGLALGWALRGFLGR